MAYEGNRSGGPRRRYGRRKVCRFCADKKATIDYKKISVHCVTLFPSVARLLHGGFPVPVRIIREN